MRKGILLFLLPLLFLLGGIASRETPEAVCDGVLSSMGFSRGGAFSKEEVVLPKRGDITWDAYLDMQTENGYTLCDYAGRAVLRLSCSVGNHPKGAAYATFYWQGGQLLGGDVLSPALDGFLMPIPPQK